jgi:hypothetical protein
MAKTSGGTPGTNNKGVRSAMKEERMRETGLGEFVVE